jgi:UDP-N-acetylmuramoylalanine--D-glutamate ligase
MIHTPVAIVGMGKSGESAARLLLFGGLKKADLLLFDQKAPLSAAGIQFRDPEVLMREGRPRTLVVSPGVPLSSPWIVEAKKAGVQITSEINLACQYLEEERIIGVTGSLGKSTTVSLLGEALKAFDENGFVGGNLGVPFCDYAFEVASGQRPRAHWIVLELSSYQLENCADLKLEHSAITFLSPNHMERYESLEDYYKTKWKIVSLTKGEIFLNLHGGDVVAFAEKQPEFSRCLVCSKDQKSLQPHALSHSKLLGVHNQDNIALAAQIALHCHWPISSLQAMKAFTGLEHRIENLGLFDGIQFINDSKATAIDSVMIAVKMAHSYLQEQGRLFVLLGGKDKNLPWEELLSLGLLPSVDFIFFGECRDVAKKKSGLSGASFVSLDAAMDAIFLKASTGDIVLLSPGGTSFDEFKGFEDRGRFFKEKIRTYYSSSRN